MIRKQGYLVFAYFRIFSTYGSVCSRSRFIISATFFSKSATLFFAIKNKNEDSNSSNQRTAAETYIDDKFQNISKDSITTIDGKSYLVLDDITPIEYNIITQNEVLMNILKEKYNVSDLTITISGKAIRESLNNGTSED